MKFVNIEKLENFLQDNLKNEVNYLNYVDENYISKDKIKDIISKLEKEQEHNRKELERGINYLSNTMIDSAVEKININFSIREFLQELLKERN